MPEINIIKPVHRILIVDDAGPIRRILRKIIESAGYIVEDAKDGTQALDLLRTKNKHFHLILLDIMMPMKDGYATLKEIREDPLLKKTPVIMITAKSARKDVLNAAQYSISGYILKPFKPAEIQKKLAGFLAGINPAAPVGPSPTQAEGPEHAENAAPPQE